jgi:flavin reductase (DIM6/NTAB) family NADH-FMN oxidoreductase RutF
MARRTPVARKSLPLSRAYRLLEPGPVVLLTTAQRGRANVMTMSWHTMLEFAPPLIAECWANLECCVVDTRRVPKYCGEFMVAGRTLRLASKAK